MLQNAKDELEKLDPLIKEDVSYFHQKIEKIEKDLEKYLAVLLIFDSYIFRAHKQVATKTLHYTVIKSEYDNASEKRNILLFTKTSLEREQKIMKKFKTRLEKKNGNVFSRIFKKQVDQESPTYQESNKKNPLKKRGVSDLNLERTIQKVLILNESEIANKAIKNDKEQNKTNKSCCSFCSNDYNNVVETDPGPSEVDLNTKNHNTSFIIINKRQCQKMNELKAMTLTQVKDHLSLLTNDIKQIQTKITLQENALSNLNHTYTIKVLLLLYILIRLLINLCFRGML